MDFEELKVQQLILQESFKEWVLFNDPEAAVRWDQWLRENPGEARLVAEARKILQTLRIEEDKPTSLEFQEDWLRIQAACK